VLKSGRCGASTGCRALDQRRRCVGLHRRGQRALHRVENELMHGARFPEADFRLGRVHVDVDQRRIDLDEQADGRLAAAVQHVAVGLAQRVGDHLVADEAAIDEDVLAVLGVGRAGRVDREAGDRKRPGLRVDRARRADEVIAEQVGDAPRAVGRRQLEQAAAVVGQAEGRRPAGSARRA
jgi:hypothetical protein